MVTESEIFIITLGAVGLVILALIAAVLWRRRTAIECLLASLLTWLPMLHPAPANASEAAPICLASLGSGDRPKKPEDAEGTSLAVEPSAVEGISEDEDVAHARDGDVPDVPEREVSAEDPLFRALFQAYFARVLTTVQRHGMPPRHAERVAEEVFLEAFKTIGPWLMTTTYRVLRARRAPGPAEPTPPSDDPDKLKN